MVLNPPFFSANLCVAPDLRDTKLQEHKQKLNTAFYNLKHSKKDHTFVIRVLLEELKECQEHEARAEATQYTLHLLRTMIICANYMQHMKANEERYMSALSRFDTLYKKYNY